MLLSWHTYVYVYVCVVHTSVLVCACAHARVCVCVCVCNRACVCACVCVLHVCDFVRVQPTTPRKLIQWHPAGACICGFVCLHKLYFAKFVCTVCAQWIHMRICTRPHNLNACVCVCAREISPGPSRVHIFCPLCVCVYTWSDNARRFLSKESRIQCYLRYVAIAW